MCFKVANCRESADFISFPSVAYGEDEDDASSGEDEDDRHVGGDVPGLQSKEGDDNCDEGSYLCCFWGEGVEDLHRRRQTKRERVSLLKKNPFFLRERPHTFCFIHLKNEPAEIFDRVGNLYNCHYMIGQNNIPLFQRDRGSGLFHNVLDT